MKNQPVKINFSFLFFSLMLLALAGFLIFGMQETSVVKVTYTNFLQYVKDGSVKEVNIADKTNIKANVLSANGQFSTVSVSIPYDDPELMDLLKSKNVVVSGSTTQKSIIDTLFSYLPWIICMIIILSIFRQNMAQSARGMKFAESRAKIFDKNGKKINFEDVAGQEEAKTELAEIVDFLKSPEKYEKIGAKIPHGVLLVGNPGTGKTLLARAVAGEADVNFLHISGSDFVEMFVGVGASRVRNLFDQARRLSPAVVFIDEIDAVGRARGAGLGGGHDEREQTLNQLLVEMDGFEQSKGVIVLAATNRPDVLDPALLRPGRFDRQVTVAMPDIKEREAIIKVHTKPVPLADDVDIPKLARATSGMSGADLANIINEAALFTARKNKEQIENEDIEEARDKILMGLARKSLVMSEKNKLMTAYHEAGHALPYYFLKNSTPLHKVTIIPRGRALGVTIGLPSEDTYCQTKSQLMDRLVILYGGYVAEYLVYGETTTGTQNDIQQATDLAHHMVCEWGMSSLGAISFGQEDEPVFMGKEFARHKELSDFSAELIDKSVKEILSEAKETTRIILSENREKLDLLAKTLVEKETLDDTDIKQLLGFNE